MRRITALGAALLLVVVGCSSPVPAGEPVELLTGAMPFDQDECTRDRYIVSMLLVDPRFGTTLAGYPDTRAPVMWPPGFTGRRIGSDVIVLDPDGRAVAATGRSYDITGNMLFDTPEWSSEYRRGLVLSTIGVDMFYACGPVRPAPTSVPPGEQCGLSFPCPTRPD